jgi:hypothetical protein
LAAPFTRLSPFFPTFFTGFNQWVGFANLYSLFSSGSPAARSLSYSAQIIFGGSPFSRSKKLLIWLGLTFSQHANRQRQ